ncbi:ABC transporter ATP-binding protein [Bacillus sp. 1P06AnD]|uniref:ABC transporter ATP-binding protein n=1 Tax=Bacillus sp. 1P06AnD TaxID=3132208 RepID=UPI00399F3267
MLSLNNICKSYPQDDTEIPILKNITLSIEKGDYISIMGPSGSGKSTLMNILGCLDRPSSGTYELNGRNVEEINDNNLSDIRNAEIGFVFQNFNLLPRLSVLQNVELPLLYAGESKDNRQKKALIALRRVGLEERVHFLPTKLSGGQKQRVAIARALVTEAEFILADEPTGALDTKTGAQIMDLLTELNEQGKTIILITHEQEIADYANRHLIIKDGKIVSDKRKVLAC